MAEKYIWTRVPDEELPKRRRECAKGILLSLLIISIFGLSGVDSVGAGQERVAQALQSDFGAAVLRFLALAAAPAVVAILLLFNVPVEKYSVRITIIYGIFLVGFLLSPFVFGNVYNGKLFVFFAFSSFLFLLMLGVTFAIPWEGKLKENLERQP